MSLAISITALVISLASFSFNLYQYRNARKVGLLTKINEVMKHAHLVSKAAHEFRYKASIAGEDEVDIEVIKKIESLLEIKYATLLDSKNITLENCYELEKVLLGLEMEISLYTKTLEESIEFNS